MNLREEFDKLKQESLTLVELSKTRSLTEDEKKDAATKLSRMKEIDSILKTEKQLAGLELEADDDIKKIAVSNPVKTEYNKRETVEVTNEAKTEAKIAVKELNTFATTSGRSTEKFTITSATDSGLLMPKSVLPTLLPDRSSRNAIRRGFAALGVPTYNTGTTENITMPLFDDVANLANNDQEGVATCVAADPTSSGVALNVKEYHSKALFISKKVLYAQNFDLTQYIYPKLISRIERKEEADWIAAIIADAAVTTAAVTTASATAVTLGETMSLDEALGSEYEGSPAFYVVSPAFRSAVRRLADTTNKPFFGLEGTVERLFGKPVFTSSSLGAMTTGLSTAILISTDGAVIRDSSANELVKYENDCAHPGAVGFEALAWSAFAYVPSAVRKIKMA